MEPTPLSNKAPPAADVLPSAAQQAVDPPDDAAAGRVRTSRGGGVEDDDEQVERFYALLDNIRAMRGMLGTSGGTATAGRKRAREAEPPWRPAFRMEDFELEEVQSAGVAPCCDAMERTKKENSCCAWRPAAARRGTTDGDEVEEEGEVVEARGPRRAPRKARRAAVLAVDRLGSR